jgi:hypothetical protein
MAAAREIDHDALVGGRNGSGDGLGKIKLQGSVAINDGIELTGEKVLELGEEFGGTGARPERTRRGRRAHEKKQTEQTGGKRDAGDGPKQTSKPR